MASKPKVDRQIWTNNCSRRGAADIDYIVMHYTWSRNMDGVIRHFLSGSPKVSAHYIVGQDGELVQMVPDDEAAWHAGSSPMNLRSIGIEHCAAEGDRITPAQERTSAELIRWLVASYNIPTKSIIPHVAVKSTSCPGDLFGAYGGKAGADAATQGRALNRWLAECVFNEPETAPSAPEPEIAMSPDASPPTTGPLPYPYAEPGPAAMPVQHPEAQPASSSLTIWGAVTSLLAFAVPYVANKTGIPITTELVMGLAGVVMTIIGRAATSPLKLR